MNKISKWLSIGMVTALLLQGCSQASSPDTGKPSTTQPGQQTGQPAAPNQPNASQQPAPPPAKGGQAEQPVANKEKPVRLNLTRELTVNPAMKIGTSTYDELAKKFGKPVQEKTVNTPFRTELTKKDSKLPQIQNITALFHVNPITGEKMEKSFPYNFTNDKKKVLVTSQILPRRSDLIEKIKTKSITLDDFKRVYGKPTRESETSLEYYDFDNNIVLLIANKKGSLTYQVTKYDLLYGSNTTDLKAHEETIQRLAKENK
ncbi:hypothetical protein [Brevibacillus sp. SYSU BS000544]|uniref:hypothetical protein n=1 Tax=Brevibacillus sp. SYSU BS000544 TaxID=3416443 RepID=UPI003CE48C91